MLAISGSGWKLAPSLVIMVKEANKLAPNRSEASDGSIGDTAHAARSSFHNPLNGFVDAVDLTHDPLHGWDVHARARELVKRGDVRLDHVISMRQIWSTTHQYWRPYTGTNAHDRHAHFACKRSSVGRVPTSLWWPAGTVSADPVNLKERSMDIIHCTENAQHYAVMPDGLVRLDEEEYGQLAYGGANAIIIATTALLDKLVRGKRIVSFVDPPVLGG